MMGLPQPVAEHAFAKSEGRKFRFDWAWESHLVALEVEGGVWIQGRHNRASGFLADLGKYNLAAALGWRVVRVTPQQLLTNYTAQLLKRLLT